MKIKWSFHELSTKNHTAYNRELYRASPEDRKKRSEYQKKHCEEHRKASLKYIHNHKRWIVRNCQICGRFCSKNHSKYCQDCANLILRLNHNALTWIRRQDL